MHINIIFIISFITLATSSQIEYKINQITHTITFSGKGDMKDYLKKDEVPWISELSDLEEVIIGDEITSIGDYSFAHFKNITKLTIGKNVKIIGERSFFNTSIEE